MDQLLLMKQTSLSRTLRVLLVEDVPNDAMLIELSLEDAELDCKLEIVSSAVECETHLRNHTYDAMLSDFRLPGFDGLKALEILKVSGQEIPFILVTGSLGEESAVECIKAGMTDYVLKDRLFRLPMVLKRALEEYDLRRQRTNAIAQIRQQAWQLKIINQILQAMRESLLLEDVLQTTADNLQQSLQVSFCLIIQNQKDLQVYTKGVCTQDFDEDALLHSARELADHYHKRLIQGQQIVCHEMRSLPSRLQPVVDQLQLTGFIISPLLYHQKYLGSISLYHCGSDRIWLDAEQTLLKAIADQCAIALHQAELYQNVQTELQERKKIEQKLRYDALHDTLTDLPNRSLILDRLNHALERFKRQSCSQHLVTNNFAVLYLDLDQFKLINDSLGHSTGDQLLIKASELLKATLRSEDSLGRLGGDEFVILLEGVSTLSDVLEVVHRIQKSFEDPIRLGEQDVTTSTSIGIVISSLAYEHPEELLRDADTAMYRAKKKRRGSYAVFDPEMHIQVMSQLKTANYLRNAIDYQELQVYYQPIVCLKRDCILGFEALVRWHHPKLGLILPQEFIPVAEETGLIMTLDLWVLENACRQLRQWQDLYPGLDSVFVSVNLSGQHFSQTGLLTKIDEILSDVQLAPECLTVEITENVLIEKTTLATSILNQLKARNISISLDDFGTGYTSLSYLHRFPINTIKLDQSFVSNLEENARNQEIVKAIVDLGHNLGLKIVAEGIETLDHIGYLANFGCQAGQGFYFSKPINSDKAATWLYNTHQRG